MPSWVLEFCSVGELSCWGCGLKIECQIAYPSVTGKVRNLQKSEFWSISGILACVIYTVPEFEKIFGVSGAGQKVH